MLLKQANMHKNLRIPTSMKICIYKYITCNHDGDEKKQRIASKHSSGLYLLNGLILLAPYIPSAFQTVDAFASNVIKTQRGASKPMVFKIY